MAMAVAVVGVGATVGGRANALAARVISCEGMRESKRRREHEATVSGMMHARAEGGERREKGGEPIIPRRPSVAWPRKSPRGTRRR